MSSWNNLLVGKGLNCLGCSRMKLAKVFLSVGTWRRDDCRNCRNGSREIRRGESINNDRYF